jgi:hypothetical protein
MTLTPSCGLLRNFLKKWSFWSLWKPYNLNDFFHFFHKTNNFSKNYNSIPFQNSNCRQNWIKIEFWGALLKLYKNYIIISHSQSYYFSCILYNFIILIGKCSKYCQRAKYCQLPIKRTIVIIYTINYFWKTFATIFFRLIVYLIVYCISSALNWQLTVFGSLTVFGTPPYIKIFKLVKIWKNLIQEK